MKLLDSRDPAMNAAIAALLIVAGAMAFVGFAVIAIPVLIIAGLWKLYTYHNPPQPTPTTQQLIEQNRAHAIPQPEEVLGGMFRQNKAQYLALPTALYEAMLSAAVELYDDEDLAGIDRPPPPQGTLEEARYRDASLTRLKKAGNIARVNQLFQDTLNGAFISLIDTLPTLQQSTDGDLSIRLLDTVKNPQRSLDALINPFFNDEIKEYGLFKNLKTQLEKNATRTGKFVRPIDFKGPPEELLSYLEHTDLYPVFKELLNAHLPFSIEDKYWAEHAFIAAPRGHGKTHTLKFWIKHFIDRPQPPGMIIIDEMGAMLKLIREKYAHLGDKIVVIEPSGPNPPQINFFKLNAPPSLYFYIFKAVDQSLTSRQATMLTFLVELLSHEEHPTFYTLLDLLENKTKITDYPASMAKVSEAARRFFENQFQGKDSFINATKLQVASRLYALMAMGNFNTIFSAPRNDFNARKFIDEGKIVLVSTHGMDAGSAVFGRFVIASCLAAALSREDTPEPQRNFALLIVDEAKDYMDETTGDILSKTRQFKLSMVQATQHLRQVPPNVLASVLSNTSVKFSGPVEGSDPIVLAKAMRCEPAFIQSMKSYDYKASEWACYVRNYTDSAVKLTIPMGVLERMPNAQSPSKEPSPATSTEAMPEYPQTPKPNHAQSPPKEASSDPVQEVARAVSSTPPIVSPPATKPPHPEQGRKPVNQSTRDPDTDYHHDP